MKIFMFGIFDSHCHLMSEEYNNDEISEIINNAKINGVTSLNNVGYDINSSLDAVRQAIQYENVYATVGIHPTNINKYSIIDLKKIDKLANSHKVIAIGEIGLDLYHKNNSLEIQKKWFINQISIAKKHNLPIIVHCRDAYEECYNILLNEKIKNVVIHCYNSDILDANKFLDLGFYLSFAGNLTFKNSEKLQNVIKKIKLNKILVETDAPYLTPDPYRGKKNYPEFIIHTVKKISELKKMPLNEVIKNIEKNSRIIFNLEKKNNIF